MKWGAYLENPKNTHIAEIIGADKDGIYVLRKTPILFLGFHSVKIELYSSNMEELLNSKEVGLSYNEDKLIVEFIVLTYGKLFLLGSFSDLENKKSYLFAQEINKKTFEPEGSSKKIAEANSSGRYQKRFSIEFSEDKSRIAISCWHDMSKADNKKFGIAMLDSEMNVLWSRDVELEYNHSMFEQGKICVDQNGNFYITAKIFTQNKGINDLFNFSFILISIVDNGANQSIAKIQANNDLIYGLQMQPDEKGNLFCAGFYGTKDIKKDSFVIHGMLSLSINPLNGEVANQKLKIFTDDLVSQITGSEKKKPIRNFDLDRIIFGSDKSPLFICKFFTTKTYNLTDSYGRGYTATAIHYGNILATNFNSDNEATWTTIIPNDFYLKKPLTISSLYQSNNHVYFIFYQKIEKKQWQVNLITLDSSGKYEKVILATIDDRNIGYWQINNDVMFCDENKGDFRFGRTLLE